MIFEVTITRTERITFEIDAENDEDAEARYLTDGDEVWSRTLDLKVLEIEGPR